MRTGPVDHNVTSLKHLRTLLIDVIHAPQDFLADGDLHAALKSQHMLAKYTSADKRITPSSLNTQKRLSANLVKDGYEDGYEDKYEVSYAGLNKLRCKAAERLRGVALVDEKEKRNNRSVAGLKENVADLKNQLSIARQDCWHLSTAFARAIAEATNLAKGLQDLALQAKWAKSRQELLSMVTLSSQGLYCTFPVVGGNETNE